MNLIDDQYDITYQEAIENICMNLRIPWYEARWILNGAMRQGTLTSKIKMDTNMIVCDEFIEEMQEHLKRRYPELSKDNRDYIINMYIRCDTDSLDDCAYNFIQDLKN